MTDKPTLWNAGNDLATAEHQMSNLRVLFIAIQKLGSDEVVGLARIGQGIAEEWEDTFADQSEKFYLEHQAQKDQQEGEK